MADQDFEKIQQMMAKMLSHNRQEILEDMKQFTRAEISQSEIRTEEKLKDLKTDIKELKNRMDDGFTGVGEAIEAVHQLHDDHDNQLKRLKQKIA